MAKGFVGALAILSLLLPVGWQWLQKNPALDKRIKQRWVGNAADFFYFVGLPYAALLFGVLTPQFLGLKGLEYLSLVLTSNAAIDPSQVLALVLVQWLVDAGSALGAGMLAVLIWAGVVYLLARRGVTELYSTETLLDTVYYTIHWAFYWALFWILTGDLYLGVVFGSGWVMLEWILIARMQQIPFYLRPPQLLQGAILIFIATIYVYWPNLWLLWPIHVAMVMATRFACQSEQKLKRIEN